MFPNNRLIAILAFPCSVTRSNALRLMIVEDDARSAAKHRVFAEFDARAHQTHTSALTLTVVGGGERLVVPGRLRDLTRPPQPGRFHLSMPL
jgi:hypothetical protein